MIGVINILAGLTFDEVLLKWTTYGATASNNEIQSQALSEENREGHKYFCIDLSAVVRSTCYLRWSLISEEFPLPHVLLHNPYAFSVATCQSESIYPFIISSLEVVKMCHGHI